MDSYAEEEPMQLRLFSSKPIGPFPETATPPHRSSLSVPFRWEEEPGKPRPCLALVTVPATAPSDAVSRALELPPRLLFAAETKLPSPTTVLDGPYVGRRRFHSSSSSSFRSTSGRHVSFSPERGLVVRNRGFKSWFGSWRRRRRGSGGNKEEVAGGSLVFPASEECGSVKVTTMRRAASFSSLTIPRSHFWRTIYEGLKQALPWKSKKLKKGI